jgi:hypothetical protein
LPLPIGDGRERRLSRIVHESTLPPRARLSYRPKGVTVAATPSRANPRSTDRTSTSGERRSQPRCSRRGRRR